MSVREKPMSCPWCSAEVRAHDDGDPRWPWVLEAQHRGECPLYLTSFRRSYSTEGGAIAAWTTFAAREVGDAGWIVGNGDGTAWRTWENGFSTWVKEREFATRYARREDAENVHREDEDAWTVQLYAAPAVESESGEHGADAARYRWLRDHSCPPHNFYISVPDEFSGVRYNPSEVDAYIDAALAAINGEST